MEVDGRSSRLRLGDQKVVYFQDGERNIGGIGGGRRPSGRRCRHSFFFSNHKTMRQKAATAIEAHSPRSLGGPLSLSLSPLGNT